MMDRRSRRTIVLPGRRGRRFSKPGNAGTIPGVQHGAPSTDNSPPGLVDGVPAAVETCPCGWRLPRDLCVTVGKDDEDVLDTLSI